MGKPELTHAERARAHRAIAQVFRDTADRLAMGRLDIEGVQQAMQGMRDLLDAHLKPQAREQILSLKTDEGEEPDDLTIWLLDWAEEQDSRAAFFAEHS